MSMSRNARRKRNKKRELKPGHKFLHAHDGMTLEQKVRHDRRIFEKYGPSVGQKRTNESDQAKKYRARSVKEILVSCLILLLLGSLLIFMKAKEQLDDSELATWFLILWVLGFFMIFPIFQYRKVYGKEDLGDIGAFKKEAVL